MAGNATSKTWWVKLQRYDFSVIQSEAPDWTLHPGDEAAKRFFGPYATKEEAMVQAKQMAARQHLPDHREVLG